MKSSNPTKKGLILLKQWHVFAKNFLFSCAILDEAFFCVEYFGEKYIQKGECIIQRTNEPLPYPMVMPCDIVIMSHGENICAKIIPIWYSPDDFEPSLYFVIFFDSIKAFDIMSRTDVILKLKPLLGSIEEIVAKAWSSLESLEEMLDAVSNTETKNAFSDIKTNVSDIAHLTNNAFSFASMITEKPIFKRLDAIKYCDMLIKRCNAALAKCGRHIQFLCADRDLYISVDTQHALSAMANLLQNALLYSPRDFVPIITVTKSSEENRSVEIRITNDRLTYSDCDFSDLGNIGYSYNQIGFGLQIIEYFVKECGGTMNTIHNNGMQTITLSFPEITDGRIPCINFETLTDLYSAKQLNMYDSKFIDVVKRFTYL